MRKYVRPLNVLKRDLLLKDKLDEAAKVDAEIKRMATRFSLPVDRWLQMLQEERGVNLSQYSGDIIWPSLALRKLAGDRLVVSQEELIKEHEKQFGPAVRARMIVCDSLQKASVVQARAAELRPARRLPAVCRCGHRGRLCHCLAGRPQRPAAG